MKKFQTLCGGKFNVELEVFGTGEPLLFLHGAFGLVPEDGFLEELGRDFNVIAPHLPGFGESTGGDLIEDVIDAALFYHELLDELKIPSVNIVGHSMGAMLAAELAALDTHMVKKLVLAAPFGLWLDEQPIPDLFATQLFELPELLFHDPKSTIAKTMTAVPTLPTALGAMNMERTKRFGMASKFLFPIPYRGRVHQPHQELQTAGYRQVRAHDDARAAGGVLQRSHCLLERVNASRERRADPARGDVPPILAPPALPGQRIQICLSQQRFI